MVLAHTYSATIHPLSALTLDFTSLLHTEINHNKYSIPPWKTSSSNNAKEPDCRCESWSNHGNTQIWRTLPLFLALIGLGCALPNLLVPNAPCMSHVSCLRRSVYHATNAPWCRDRGYVQPVKAPIVQDAQVINRRTGLQGDSSVDDWTW